DGDGEPVVQAAADDSPDVGQQGGAVAGVQQVVGPLRLIHQHELGGGAAGGFVDAVRGLGDVAAGVEVVVVTRQGAFGVEAHAVGHVIGHDAGLGAEIGALVAAQARHLHAGE